VLFFWPFVWWDFHFIYWFFTDFSWLSFCGSLLGVIDMVGLVTDGFWCGELREDFGILLIFCQLKFSHEICES
jgi:hypothetical protein